MDLPQRRHRAAQRDAGAVTVLDHRRQPIGTALWSPQSEISLRLLDRDPDAHIDDAWWHERIAARASRDAIRFAIDANAYRLIHGEGDALPSLVCDRYDRWLVVQLLSAGLEHFRDDVVAALLELTGRRRHPRAQRPTRPSTRRTPARNDAALRRRPAGDRSRSNTACATSPHRGPDRRPARSSTSARRARRAATLRARQRARLLQLPRLVRAAPRAQRADHVTALDSSRRRARARGRERRAQRPDEHRVRRGERVRLPPRAGARRRDVRHDRARPAGVREDEAALTSALRGYHEINLRAMRLLAPGGFLYTASCSYHLTKPLFLEMIERAAADSGRRLALREFDRPAARPPRDPHHSRNRLHQGRDPRSDGLTSARRRDA